MPNKSRKLRRELERGNRTYKHRGVEYDLGDYDPNRPPHEQEYKLSKTE